MLSFDGTGKKTGRMRSSMLVLIGWILLVQIDSFVIRGTTVGPKYVRPTGKLYSTGKGKVEFNLVFNLINLKKLDWTFVIFYV